MLPLLSTAEVDLFHGTADQQPTQWRNAPLQLAGKKEQILFGHELCFQQCETDFSAHQGNQMNQFYMKLKAEVWHAAGESQLAALRKGLKSYFSLMETLHISVLLICKLSSSIP